MAKCVDRLSETVTDNCPQQQAVPYIGAAPVAHCLQTYAPSPTWQIIPRLIETSATHSLAGPLPLLTHYGVVLLTSPHVLAIRQAQGCPSGVLQGRQRQL